MELLTETLGIPATEGQFLIIYHAEPGSQSHQALMRLARMVASEHFEIGIEPSTAEFGPDEASLDVKPKCGLST